MCMLPKDLAFSQDQLRNASLNSIPASEKNCLAAYRLMSYLAVLVATVRVVESLFHGWL